MSSESEYKLSVELYGHSSDIRTITSAQHNNCLISGSRDRTTKLWTPNKFNAGYTEAKTYKSHENYIGAVCILSPTPTFPDGLILTGGYDKAIFGTEPQATDPLFKEVQAHLNAVVKLVCGNKENTFLSASWDCTAKLWTATRDGIICKVTFSGHSASVWSVAALNRDLVATASADKTINIYSSAGVLIRKLEGHTDVVRDVVAYNDSQILSNSHDGTVKHWDVENGQCLRTLYQNKNFIFSLSYSNGMIATCGEDGYLCIWRNDNKQTISLPCQTVWVATILPNTDIATGCSDGVVRIFTADPQRQADDEIIKAFENNVGKIRKVRDKGVGGVPISSLPGKEALREPGRSDGQTKMIREGSEAVCYTWSDSEKRWDKIGHVLGENDGAQLSSGKVLFEGKEYDYVFSVDVEDGKPPLKLPYNRTDDPWVCAQAFIQKHNLFPDYLDEVAKFIISNSKSESTGFAGHSNSQYVDPFTGASRYVPGNNGDNFQTNDYNNAYDKTASRNNAFSGESVFPLSTYIAIDVGNLKNVLAKLIDFNKTQVDSQYSCSEDQLAAVVTIGDINLGNFHSESFNLLKQLLLHWPIDCQFPLTDILRLAVRKEAYNEAVCKDNELLNFVISNLTADVPISNRVTLFRMVCNMFCHKSGEQFAFDKRDILLQAVAHASSILEKNKLLQISVNSVLANLSALFYRRNDIDSQAVLLVNAVNILPATNDPESLSRLLISLGTALKHQPDFKAVVEDDVKAQIVKLTNHESDKVKNYVKAVLSLLK